MFFLNLLLFLLLLPFLGGIILYYIRKNSQLDISINQTFFDQRFLVIDFVIKNKGNFHSIILDFDVNFLPPVKYLQKKIIYNNKHYYFDTVILKSNKEMEIRVVFEFEKSIKLDSLDNLGLFAIVTYYDLKPIRFLYKEFYLKDLINNIRDKLPEDLESIEVNLVNNKKHSNDFYIIEKDGVFCLKTPIITHFSDIDYLVEATLVGLENLKNSDNSIVCFAESLIAIVQKRAYCVYGVTPSILSLIFNHYFNEDSSLSSPYALELVLREIGFGRFYIALYSGIIGKLFRVNGWFYVVAGRKAAAVDDAGGTIRPYDKFVVLAPDQPNSIAKQIKDKIKQIKNINIEVCIVDSNDLGKVDILGTTNMDYNKLVIEKLKTNPQGNDDQQTPIIFIPIH